MAHQVRSAFSKVFKTPARKLGLQQVYDVSHNIAKQEVHTLPDGTQTKVLCTGAGAEAVLGVGRAPCLQCWSSVILT